MIWLQCEISICLSFWGKTNETLESGVWNLLSRWIINIRNSSAWHVPYMLRITSVANLRLWLANLMSEPVAFRSDHRQRGFVSRIMRFGNISITMNFSHWRNMFFTPTHTHEKIWTLLLGETLSRLAVQEILFLILNWKVHGRFSQETSTGPYPELAESSPYSHN
jgi:hypothetical protein